ncbi:MAG: 30S ribosome-binding factor RbfA [Balneolales bacterium]|nr:30S ribosome-binding factor RbfA [Balneolales bacterium]
MSIRTERLASVIKNDISRILQKYQNNNMITVTAVKVTPDLSIARINLSVIDTSGSEEAVYDLLNEKKTEIRTELAKLLRHQVRKIPEIQFFRDETAEYASKMEKLFRKAKTIENPDNLEEN